MQIKTLGVQVKAGRTALGLSQQRLADLAGVSRATINELERGTINELGMNRLAGILDILGLALHVEPRAVKKNGLSMAALTASVSYKDSMTSEDLAQAFASGVIPPGYAPHIATLLDEASLQILVPAVQEAAELKHVAPKVIWRHLGLWARQMQSPRSIWRQ